VPCHGKFSVLNEECIFEQKRTPCNFALCIARQSLRIASFIESELTETDSKKSLVECCLFEQGWGKDFEKRLLTPFPPTNE
jgi:hypothetical protein